MTFVKNDNAALTGNTEETDLYCVVAGSSAGGFETIKELLINLPSGSGNFSMVLSHPLEEEQFIALDSLLSANPLINICRPAEGEKLRPGMVYAPAHGETIRIVNAAISLQNGIQSSEGFAADALFQSAALHASDKAIAVVLSGTGNDGSSGIKSVKAAGGRVLVQMPQTAKYDGMPKAAICTCSVDEILNPAEIGKAIGLIVNRPHLAETESIAADKNASAQQGKVVVMSASLVSVEAMVKEALYASYQHAYLLIDKDADIRQINGDATLYLDVSNLHLPCNLYSVLSDELLPGVKDAVDAVIKNGIENRSNIEIIELSNKIFFVRIIVKPVENSAGSEELFVVVFENLEPHRFVAKGINITDKIMVGAAMQQLASRIHVT